MVPCSRENVPIHFMVVYVCQLVSMLQVTFMLPGPGPYEREGLTWDGYLVLRRAGSTLD